MSVPSSFKFKAQTLKLDLKVVLAVISQQELSGLSERFVSVFRTSLTQLPVRSQTRPHPESSVTACSAIDLNVWFSSTTSLSLSAFIKSHFRTNLENCKIRNLTRLQNTSTPTENQLPMMWIFIQGLLYSLLLSTRLRQSWILKGPFECNILKGKIKGRGQV